MRSEIGSLVRFRSRAGNLRRKFYHFARNHIRIKWRCLGKSFVVMAIDWVLMLQPFATIIISSKLGYSANKPSTLKWCSTATAEDTQTRIDCAVEVYTFYLTDLLPCLIFEVWRKLHLSRLNLLVRCENIVAVFETRCAQLMNERSHTNLVEQPKFCHKIWCRELIVEPVLCDCRSSSHWGCWHLLAHYSLHGVSLQLTTEVVK